MLKRRWDELSDVQQGAIVLAGAVQLALVAAALGGHLPAADRGDPGRKATVDRGGVHQLHRPDLLLPVRAEMVETPQPAGV